MSIEIEPGGLRRDPPAPTPPERMLPLLRFFRALNTNPITAWPMAAYTEPHVALRGSRFLPDMLFVTEPALVKRVLVDAVEIYDKGDVVRRRLRPALGDSVLIAAIPSWRPQRRVTAPMFQPRRIDAFYPAMLAAVRDEARRLDAHAGTQQAVNMHTAMLGLTYDVVSRTAFSSDGVSDPAAFSRAIAAYFDTLGRVDLASFLALPEWIPTLGRLRARPALRLFRREIGGVIERRRGMMARDGVEGLPDDLLTRLLTTPDPQTGQPLSDALVYDNAMTFLAAGHETTANTLCWTLFLLSEHPEWDGRLIDEIEREIGDRDPVAADLARLTATRMVVDEAMRLYPPAPLIPRMALREDRLGDLDVRKGAIVFTSPYVSHRHRAYWDAPDAFRPERFAPGAREAIDRHVYFPFGLGPRVCMGAGFAIQEILLALAILLKRYRFIATAPDDVFPQATITLSPGGRLNMRIERR